MADSPQLEIMIERDESAYFAEARSISPDGQMILEGDIALKIDLERLRALKDDPERYGQALGEMMWSGAARSFLERSLGDANAATPLRLRLAVHPSAHELHAVRWELMTGVDGSSLTSRDAVAFSRFLSSTKTQQSRPAAPRLSMLVAVASPVDLEAYGLASLDVVKEIARMRDLVSGSFEVIPLAGACSVRNLIVHLRRDMPDVLYLLCHGKLIESEPHLFLEEDENRTTAHVNGRMLISSLDDLTEKPRLIVLGSCESGGDGRAARLDERFPLAALGPRMAEGGIPAVVAMMGEITLDTIEKFFPVFFKGLSEHWTIDTAMSEARSAVRALDRPDWYVPVLFTRLVNTTVWYRPGLEGGSVRWGSIVTSIRDGDCTAVVGPDLGEMITGSQRDLAASVAKRTGFPLASYLSEDLASVTQYLEYAQNRRFWQRALTEARITSIRNHYAEELPEELRQSELRTLDAPALLKLFRDMRSVVRKILKDNDRDPYTHLARLPIKCYITADPSPLLVEALRENGKEPQEVVCVWRDDLHRLEHSKYIRPPDGVLTNRQPIVYYVFGRELDPGSLVTTEDEFFAFMKGVVQQQQHVPAPVQAAVTASSLMFLGFGIDDWSFRAFFRTFMSSEGSAAGSSFSHVAVQIDLADGQVRDPKAARRHLIKYFEKPQIDIYWGRVREFLRALLKELAQ
ncbi:MAG TPA: CHAT domain-containing protein [Thermoanaerobaculia bacterium]|jgi:hypothetical protein|nr:CHAT domain-containing protein [Thermoanaerobaculia bacterium]